MSVLGSETVSLEERYSPHATALMVSPISSLAQTSSLLPVLMDASTLSTVLISYKPALPRLAIQLHLYIMMLSEETLFTLAWLSMMMIAR